MILVLGATGTTGGEVARQLIAAGERPRLLVRSPARAHAFEGKAEIVAGDLDDERSLPDAMRGVDRLYLMSTGTNFLELETNAVNAARKARVRHVVKLSVFGADDPQIMFSHWHHAAEHVLMKSGLAWTMLRPGNFMTNSLAWAPTIKTQGVFHQPSGTGRWAAIDPADISAVAVKALTSTGHEGQGYTLTGPEAMDAAGYAEVIARVIGRPVEFVDVPPEAAKQGMLASGLPAAYVDALLDLQAGMKAGTVSAVTDTATRLLGRPPASFESWVRRNAASFR